MFIKKIIKKDRLGNKKYTHYRLCESYRLSGKVRHRSIYNLGKLEGLDEREHKLLSDRIEDIVFGNSELIFNDIPIKIEKEAQHFARLIIKERAVDTLKVSNTDHAVKEAEYHQVDINSLENRTVREIGAEWAVKQTMDKIGVAELLGSLGMDEKEINLSYINWISRTVKPQSELATEAWLNRNTGLCELMGIESKKIHRQQLYSISRKLYHNKSAIEKYFSEKTRDLFKLEDKIILYDLTNSYFEGRMLKSKKAKFGRSKEKRNDCRIMVLALVTDSEGFIRYSNIYQGNMSDCKTLASTIEELGKNTHTQHKPTIVIDAGIASEENLKMLKNKQYQYVCVSRSAIKEYSMEPVAPFIAYDRNNEKIELKKIKQEKNEDLYLYVKSPSKQMKEASIEEKLSERYEQGLEAIKESLAKKSGIKTVEKVYERIGRLKAKYPRVSNIFNITTSQKDGKVSQLSWTKKQKATETENGIYFIRTNYTKETEEQLIWETYNCIREIESTFRCLKTELCIRPNYHQKDENIEAHIHLGLLAYQIVSIIRYQLKAVNIKDSWKNLLSKMNTQKIMTTSFIDKQQRKIHVRNCSVPETELMEIYQVLKLKPMPFYRKKSVVPQQ